MISIRACRTVSWLPVWAGKWSPWQLCAHTFLHTERNQTDLDIKQTKTLQSAQMMYYQRDNRRNQDKNNSPTRTTAAWGAEDGGERGHTDHFKGGTMTLTEARWSATRVKTLDICHMIVLPPTLIEERGRSQDPGHMLTPIKERGRSRGDPGHMLHHRNLLKPIEEAGQSIWTST